MHDGQPLIVCGKIVEDLPGMIRRGIVDGDYLYVAKPRVEDLCNAIAHVTLLPEGNYDAGEMGGGHGAQATESERARSRREPGRDSARRC